MAEHITRGGRERTRTTWSPSTAIPASAAAAATGLRPRGHDPTNDEGELVPLDDEDDEDVENKIMVMNDVGACIGCGACARVCPTNCQTHDTEAPAV